MGLKNIKEILEDSTKSSYTFVQKHPLASGALLALLILYTFLSYIYSFLVYLSPFLACTAIFVRIFWSSEQTQFKYARREDGKGEQEERKVEARLLPRIPHNNNSRRRELLYKYPSQNATSRRRNTRGRKWDVYGGLEEKAKNLSAAFHNEFTARAGNKGGGEGPVKRQSLMRSEPSMRDLVEACSNDEEAQDEGSKAIEWTEEDQRNLMDLGISELERNARLESLIARRREKKLFGAPGHVAPVVVSRGFQGFDALEAPGSAPSVMPRSPYDIPYDAAEEKPDLTGDIFLQEHACPRFTKLPGGGSGAEKGEPTTPPGEDGKYCEDTKDENAKNAPNHASEPSIRNVETTRPSEKPRPRATISHEMLNFPLMPAAAAAGGGGTTTPTSVNEYDIFPSPISKRHENVWRNCHTPTYSIASDLQVEVSEVGSLASTVDENGETNSNTDRDSVLYDGDIDRDVSSGSEDLWGASFHGRQTQRASELEDVITEANNNNSKDMATSLPNALRQLIGEEIVADVSSMASSKSDAHENTPARAINRDHNIFGCSMNEAPQSSNSSRVSSPPQQLTSCSVDHPNGAMSEEWCNLSENVINNAQAVNDLTNSATTEQVNIENSRSNEHPSTSFARQESIDDISTYSIASSPRSVLPETTTLAEDLAQQPNMEDVAPETSNDDHLPNTTPQNNHPLMDGTNDQSRNVDFDHLQEQTNNPLENSMEESNIFGGMNDAEVNNKQEEDMSKNDKNSEDNSPHLIRQGAFAESTNLVGETTIEDMNEESRALVEKEVPSTVEDDKTNKSADGNSHEDFPQPSIIEPTIPSRKENEGPQEDS